MKNFFPNIETAVIAIFVLCVALWGASRCKKKKDEASLRNATEIAVNPLDTLPSPAQTRLPPVTRQPSMTYDPNAIPASSIPNGQPVPQSYSTQPLPSSPTMAKPTAIPMPGTGATTPQVGSTTTTIKTVPATPSLESAEPNGAGLYILINGLNVRTKPDLKAKSLGKLKLNDQVYFMQEKTDIAQPVRLADGTTISKPWFKIKTKRGTIGWVHGSGVDFYKRKPQEGL
jgi:Bacterial SH3 domain